MAGKNKKTESDFIKEIETYEQQKKRLWNSLRLIKNHRLIN